MKWGIELLGKQCISGDLMKNIVKMQPGYQVTGWTWQSSWVEVGEVYRWTTCSFINTPTVALRISCCFLTWAHMDNLRRFYMGTSGECPYRLT